MNKELFIALCDHLKASVAELRWVDADMGQLNTAGTRPSVALPCCLVDMRYPRCDNHQAGRQLVHVQFTLRVAFDGCGTTSAAAPDAVRERALQCLDTLEKIHRALQWWNCSRRINPLQRASVVPERRSDSLKVYTMVYDSAFME